MVSGLPKAVERGRVSVLTAIIVSFISFLMGRQTVPYPYTNKQEIAPVKMRQTTHTNIINGSCMSQLPQVFNFIKELQCREGHMSVPPVLKAQGRGKVVVDIGLDAGDEFFTALESGYSVYGIEANPLTARKLRIKCEGATKYKCVYVKAANISKPLPPIINGGYLIEGGAGSKRGVMNMSLSGPGSSFVEVAPDVVAPLYENVVVMPVSEIVESDVFFFKLDVQGFEFEVLKGSKELFDKFVVKTLLMEVYPRGLGNANTNFPEFLQFIWNELGMMCSSANPESAKNFKIDHPGSFAGFARYLESLKGPVWWGIFDDFYCFNWKKVWNHE